MKKLLFGTTALVGALAFTGAANAQTISTGGALDLTISGSSDFGAEFADEDFGFNGGDEGNEREWFLNQDHEIVFEADGVGDATGIGYGVQLQLESQDGDGAGFDEAWGYISGNFGEFRFGNEDAVTDQLLITASFVAAGTGGVDGNQRTVREHQIADSGESTKILYFTPNVAGFQGGVSYAIKGGDKGEDAVFGEATSDHVDLGANWQGSFAGVDVGVYGGASFFTLDAEDDTVTNFQFGGYGEIFGLGVSGSYADEDEDLNARDYLWNIGVGGEFAGVGLSFNFQQEEFEDEDADSSEQYIVGADVGLLPGVVLAGDVAYVSDLDGDGDADGINALLELKTSF